MIPQSETFRSEKCNLQGLYLIVFDLSLWLDAENDDRLAEAGGVQKPWVLKAVGRCKGQMKKAGS